MALEIIIRGALEFNEPGVFIAFEETKEDLIKNVASLGFDIEELERKKLIYIDYIFINNTGYIETGDYDLEGLFIRLNAAVNKIGAKRIAIDTLEVLFSGFINKTILRSELRRLFGWLKEKNLTTIVTCEQESENHLSRFGIEEYVADCVIFLTHLLTGDINTRRLQIIKYRGSYHETNMFSFLITPQGISLLPITTLEMESLASNKRVSTGVTELDAILDHKGYYEGSSILISGSCGSGKTTLTGAFAQSVCKKKQKCLFFSYEESENEILRNLSSIGIDLNRYVHEGGYFKIVTSRPTQWGLEKHLGMFIQQVEEFKPQAVIIDPISTLSHCGTESQVYNLLVWIIDYLKKNNITLLMTILYLNERGVEFSYGISSIIDTWILLRNQETQGELNRELLIIKSRGMGHSNQIREFVLSSKGIQFKTPYLGESGILTGSARIIQEHKDLIEKADSISKLNQLQDHIKVRREEIEMQMQSLIAEGNYKKKESEREQELIDYRKEISKSQTSNMRSAKKIPNTNGAKDGKKRNK
jgi:circadian clock protein KaiC